MLTSRKRQQGVSLIELMVGMVVALVILIITASMFLLAQRGSSDTLRAAKLNLEMRNMMDMMTREVRRAGYWGTSIPDGTNPYTQGSTNLFVVQSPDTYQSTGDCILFSYDNNNNQTPDAADFIGFKKIGSNLSMRIGGTNPSNDSGCNAAGDSWQTLNDTDIQVTLLSFDISYECVNVSVDPQVSSLEPCTSGNAVFDAAATNHDLVEVRNVAIDLAAQHTNDNLLTLQLSSQVKVRNDRVITK